MHMALSSFAQHFIPSAENAYRPHILRHSWLIFFIALSLAAEGFLVANLVVRQSSEVFLADDAVLAASQTAAAETASNGGLRSTLDGLARQMQRFSSDPERITSWILGLVASIVLLAVILTLFIHPQVQPSDLLFNGVLVSFFTLTLLGLNARFL